MGSEPMGDDVYQPTGTNEQQEDGAPLDMQDALDERDYDDMLDEGYSPPEKAVGVTKHGVTAAEQHDGETLDERLAQEVPDANATAGDGVGDLPGGEGEPVDRRRAAPAPDAWSHRTRAPTPTSPRSPSPTTSASTVARRARRRPRCTSWRTRRNSPTTAPRGCPADSAGDARAATPLGAVAARASPPKGPRHRPDGRISSLIRSLR